MSTFRQLSRTFFDVHYSNLYQNMHPRLNSSDSIDLVTLKFSLYVGLPYVILAFGLISNAVMYIMVGNNRMLTVYTYFMLNLLIFDSFFILLTMTNLIVVDFEATSKRTLMTYSSLTCKTVSYLIHVLTNLSNWMKSLITYTVTSNIQSCKRLESNRAKRNATLAGLGVFSVQFLADLIFVDQTSVQQQFICAIGDLRVRLIIDLLDLGTFYFVPLYFMIKHVQVIKQMAVRYAEVNPVISQKYRKLIFSMKVAPVLFSLSTLPICLVPIVFNALLLFDFRLTSSFGFDLAMYISYLNFCFNNILNIFYNCYYNKNLRKKSQSMNSPSVFVKMKLIE